MTSNLQYWERSSAPSPSRILTQASDWVFSNYGMEQFNISHSGQRIVLRRRAKTGRTRMMASREKAMPEIVPTAKSNQNTSWGPSERNGSSQRA